MTKTEGILIFVTVVLYLSLIAGFCILFAERLVSLYNRMRMFRRLEARKREYIIESNIEKWLRQALITCLGKAIPLNIFITFETGLFVLVFIVSIKTLTPASALIVSGISASLPCLLIWVRLEGIRRKGSHEGEQLITEFLRQYRISNYNIYETLERVVIFREEIKYTRKLLYKLLFELRDTGNPKKIKKATDKFAYSINSNWSKMLAHNIFIAASKGTNISLAAEDILIQLREARAMAEERKRLNNESMRMTYYMVPFIYLSTVFMAVKYLDLSLSRFLFNQFNTPGGLILFLIIVFLFVGNIGLISMVSNQRFDY